MKISRSQFLKSGLSLAGILATRQSPAILVKSMIGSKRNFDFSDDEVEFPYVRNGLVGAWDGIYNAGLGIHSNDVNDFIDIVSKQHCIVAPQCGSYRNTEYPEYEVVENGLRSYTSGRDIGVAFPFSYNSFFGPDNLGSRRRNFTIEVYRTLFNAEKTSVRRAAIYTSNNGTGSGSVHGGDLFTWTNSKNLTVFYSGETTISTEVINGFSSVQYASTDNNVIAIHNGNLTFNKTGFWALQNNYTYSGISTSGYEAILHGLRIYNRQLSVNELMHNYTIDMERFTI